MLKLSQYFCRHSFQLEARHEFSKQNLYRCEKCGVFVIQHYGLGVAYKSKTPHLEHWVYYDNSRKAAK